ncbi:MAG: hypothetical protein ACLQGP_03645 [Isosphaeraceae bacterium]
MSKPLLKFLAGIATDPEKLGEFLRNPDEVMHEAGLSPGDIAAIQSRNASVLEARLADPDPTRSNTWTPDCPPPGFIPPPVTYWTGSYPMCPPGYAPATASPAVVVMIFPPGSPPSQGPFPAIPAAQPGTGYPATYFPQIPPNFATYLAMPQIPTTYPANPHAYPATYYALHQHAPGGVPHSQPIPRPDATWVVRRPLR